MQDNAIPMLPPQKVTTPETEPKALPEMKQYRDQKTILVDEVLNLYWESEGSFAGANAVLVEQQMAMGEALIRLRAIIDFEKKGWGKYLKTTFLNISRRTIDTCIRLAKAKIAPEYRFLGVVKLNSAITAAKDEGATSVNEWLRSAVGQVNQTCAKSLTDAKQRVDKTLAEAKKAIEPGSLKLAAAPVVAQMYAEIEPETGTTLPESTASANETGDDEAAEPEEEAEPDEVEAEDEVDEDDAELQDTADADSGSQKEQVTTEVLTEFLQHVEGILALDEQAELRSAKIDQAQNDKIAKAIEILTAIHISN